MLPQEIKEEHKYTSNYHNFHTRQIDKKILIIPLCKSVKQQRHSVYRGSPGSPNFFVRGPHNLSHNSPRAGHLTQCDCFRIYHILPNKQIFRN